tara:strand:+ start:29 stop:187 length:159 start_codon:yes stop_codon:yes gene_type:complete
MKAIIKKFVKKFGYTPTLYELYQLYMQGVLNLSDNEENTLIIQFENNKLLIK